MTIRTLVAVFGTLAIAGPVQAASLLEVYQQALQSDPRIHEAEARRLAALEAEPQARGLYLPQIDFSADWTDSDQSGSGVEQQLFFIDDDGDPNTPDVPGGVSCRPVLTRTRRFVLRQSPAPR